MNVFVLLDILLLLLIALFVPIGFWRGVQREVLVTLGILFGAALADAWALPWGRDLATLTRLRESGGAFMVAVLFLIGSTFLLGYGAGAALPVPRPGLISRLFGALVAGGNGALLLNFALRDIRVYLLPGENANFLDRAVFAHFLATGMGWLLLGAGVVFVPIVVALALFGRGTVVVEEDEEDYYVEEPSSRRPLPPRVPIGAVDERTATYKTESPRSASAAEETRPVSFRYQRERPEYLKGQSGNHSADEGVIIARGPALPDSEKTIRLDRVDEPAPEPTVEDGKCPNCHADVRDAEVFCPRCARVL
ncbi:MAG TPA: CvpA family protein [Rhodothermales bacterium]